MRKLLALSVVIALTVAAFSIASTAADDTDTAYAANQTTVRWGSFTIPAAGPGGPGELHNVIAKDSGCSWLTDLFVTCLEFPITKPCSDCYITGITPDLVDAGTDNSLNHANGGMLHHVVNVNFDRNDPTCPPNLFGKTIQQLGAVEGGNERFFAAGNERTIMNLPDGYGYRVNGGDEWGLIFHIMNMTPQPREVEFKYTFNWVSGGVEPVKPIWFDIDQCEDSEVDMAAGYNDVHWDWRSSLNGTIVGIGGHVHDYGISIALENVSRGENICTSVAGYSAGSPYAPVGPGSGADVNHPVSANVVTSDPFGLHNYHGHISDMTVCDPFKFVRGPRWWGLIPGNLLRLHTQYYRPNATDHDMGIMVAFMDLQ